MFNNENYELIPEQQREHQEQFRDDLEAKVKEQEEILENYGWEENKNGFWQKKNVPFKKIEKKF